MKNRFSIVGSIAVVLLAASARAQSIDSARGAFAARVAAYAAMHRELERRVFPGVPAADHNAEPGAVRRLREAIRAARPRPREGNVFAPVADTLRRDLRLALREQGLEPRALIAEMLDDTEEGARPPVLNEPFSWALGSAMLPSLMAALPELPDELEYRLVGPHLVLIDIDANLVVDILRDALLDTATVSKAPVPKRVPK